jgi:hypothetical protein
VQRRLKSTLDRLDDMQKPEALAKLFAAYLQGRFDLVMFRRLATALDRVPLSSIQDLNAFYSVGPGGVPLKSEYLG